MKIIDISRLITEDMVVYKNRDAKRIKRTIVANHPENHFHESRIEFDMHCGTHMDAPLHMIEHGKTIEQLDLDRFIGDCKVFDVTQAETFITKKDIEHFDIQKGDRVLFKTKNSFDNEYNFTFVYLEEDAANYLVEKEIKCFGIDAMSIERDKPGHPTHKIILGAEIGVLEDLRLKDVKPGTYFLSALPLKIAGAEGSLVRAVLLEK